MTVELLPVKLPEPLSGAARLPASVYPARSEPEPVFPEPGFRLPVHGPAAEDGCRRNSGLPDGYFSSEYCSVGGILPQFFSSAVQPVLLSCQMLLLFLLLLFLPLLALS